MKQQLLLLLFFFIVTTLLSQEKKRFSIPDSIMVNNYEELQKVYDKEASINKNKAELYMKAFLLKAKKEKEHTKIAEAYVQLHRLSNNESALLYIDSLIVFSKKQNNRSYIADGYMYKGNYFYQKGRFSKALSNYLTAKKYTNKDEETYNILDFNIGLLKLELEEFDQAIKLFANYKEYLEKNKDRERVDYLSCLYALAYTYTKLNKLDTSDYHIKIGIEKNKKIKDNELQSIFLMLSGINLYKQKKFDQSLVALSSALKLMEGKTKNTQNIALSEYYIGQILYSQNNKDFVTKFEKADSIIIKTKNVNSELRNMYPLFIDYYKKNNNKTKQLFYIEHLLTVDSILNKNNHFLSNEISKKYDTPTLLQEKENLISDLNSKNNLLYWIIGSVGIILLILIYYYKKNRDIAKLYQTKANHLHVQLSEVRSTNITASTGITASLTEKKENTKTMVLSDEKLNRLNIQLKEFENEKGFLDNKINLDSLSKELNTNRAYLSKSINELKGQTFPQYLNELRIKYVINELQNNKNLQKLTIAAIAEEIGFNNTESFATAFKKHTDTLPSYFIKALQQKQSS